MPGYELPTSETIKLTLRESRRLGRRVVAAKSSADPRVLSRAADARDVLVRANLPLAVHCGSRLAARWGLPNDEMIAEAVLGLVKAAIEWEPDREPRARFGTFAWWKIRGCCSEGRRRWSPVELLADGRAVYRGLSTYTSGGDDHSRDFGVPAVPREVPPCLESDDVEDRRERVASLLIRLTPREREAVALRFGLDGHREHTLSELGKVMGVSKERVRQLIETARARMARVPVHRLSPIERFAPMDESLRAIRDGLIRSMPGVSFRQIARQFSEITGRKIHHAAISDRAAEMAADGVSQIGKRGRTVS